MRSVVTNPLQIQNVRSGSVLAGVRAFGRTLGRLSRISGPILATAWYGFIYALSSRSSIGRPGPITGSWALNTGHALLFGLLALGLLIGIPRRDGWPVLRRSSVALVLGIILVLGALDELHQGGVPGRTMSAFDVLTDLTGASCVVWMCAYAASPLASERGTRLRFLLGLAACALAGALATLSDNYLS